MKRYLAIFGFVFALVFISGAQTTRAATIQELLAQIEALQVQLKQLQAQESSQPACYTFTKDLYIGKSGGEVDALKRFLIINNGGTIDDGAVFGEDTAEAVVRFQARYGIRQTGYVGPLTRASLNSLYACRETARPTPTVSYVQGPAEDRNILHPGERITVYGTNLQYVANVRITDPKTAGTQALIPISNFNSTTFEFFVPASLAVGPATLIVEKSDSSGNWIAVTVAKSRISTTPSVTISLPANGTTVGSVFSASGQCANYQGNVSVYYYSSYKVVKDVPCLNGQWATSITLQTNAVSGSFTLYAALSTGAEASVTVPFVVANSWESLPDYRMTAISYDPSPNSEVRTGNTFKILLTIQNSGGQNVSGRLPVTINAVSPSGDKVTFFSSYVDDAPSGQTVVREISVVAPLEYGVYNATIYLNATNQVAENNKSDNQGNLIFYIHPKG